MAEPGQSRVLVICEGPAYGDERSYNGLRLADTLAKRDEVGCCGSCMDARGMADEHLVAGTRRSTMAELADWVLWADKTVTF